jgi:hypothetical protein
MNTLLAPIAPELESAYLNELLACMGLDDKVQVKHDAIRGKGVYAKAVIYKRGDVVWEECPLVAMQNLGSFEEAPCCSHCFAYVGSCEYQIGTRLMHQIRHHESLAEEEEADEEDIAAASEQVERVSVALM